MDLSQHARRDSVQEQWLADFLDWYDARQRQPTSTALAHDRSADAAGLVEAFLRDADGNAAVEGDVRQTLLQFAADLLPAQRLAADAITCWFDRAAPATDRHTAFFDEEALPRQFADYELLERIGHGGMGVVYRARQTSLGRTVCIKMLPPGMLEPGRMQRFTEEARLAGRLHHPGIVPVFDAGSHKGQPYYVMELVEGETLSARIARDPLSAREAAASMCELAAAVQFAHDAGVLHRDLKPANVLIDSHRRLRVTDFGLGRHIDDSVSEVGVAGTPSYMAAEQVRGRPTDRRTDVYGLGAILYEMLSGRPPHVGNSPAETMRLVAEVPAIRLAQLRPGTPRDLETICHKCLEMPPARRYQSAGALHDDLNRFLRNEPVLARRAGPWERGLRWTQRHPTVAAAGAISLLSLLMLLVGGAFALWRTQAALQRTRTAEETQRQLAGQLAAAKRSSDEALYRSLVVQTVRSLETLDVEAARRSLAQIDSFADFAGSPPLEYRLLHRQAFPECISLRVGGAKLGDGGWASDGQQIIALLDEGELALIAADGTLREQASTRGPMRLLAVHPVQPVVAVSGHDGNVQIWDIAPLRLRSQFAVESASVVQIDWDPNSRELILLCDDGMLRRLEAESGEITLLPGTPERPALFAISPDGNWIAVATQDRQVMVLPQQSPPMRRPAGAAYTGLPVILTGGWIADLAWASGEDLPAEQCLALADERGRVDVWGLDVLPESDGASFQEILSMLAGPAGQASLSWQGNELLVGHTAGQLTAIDVQRATVRWRHPCLPLKKALAQPRGRHCLLLSEGSQSAALWDLSSLGVGVPVYNATVPLRSIATSDCGRLSAWRDIDGRIGTIAPQRSKAVTTFTESAVGASALAVSPTGSMLAVTRGNDVIVYNADVLEPVLRFTEHSSTVWLLSFSPDGKWVASGDGQGRVGLVCIEQPERSRLLETEGSEVRAIAFAPSGRQLTAIDGDGRLTTWSIEQRERYAGPQLAATIPHALAYVTNSQVVIGDSLGGIHLIDLAAQSQTRAWTVHDGPVWAILAAGSRVLTCGQDGSIGISDTLGNVYHRLPKQSSAVWSIAYEPITGRLWAATVAGQAIRWQLQQPHFTER